MSRTHLWSFVLGLSLAACAADESVVITHDVRYLSDTASPVSRPVASVDRIVSARAIGGSAASPVSYDGAIGADGSITFANVTALPIYVLVTYAPVSDVTDAPGNVVGYPLSSRRARIGDVHLGRPDVAPTTMATTRIAVHASGIAAWNAGSAIGLFSRSADVWAYAYTGDDTSETAAPMNGDTSIDGWTVGVETLRLPYGGTLPLFDTAHSDDVSVYHWESTSLPTGAPAPWDGGLLTRVTAYGSVDTATLADGATTPMTVMLGTGGASSFAVDYRGSELLALRTPLGVAADVGTNVFLALVHEGGTGPDYFNAVTPEVFEIATSTAFLPDDPTCFPDDMGTCDTSACPSGCNSATHPVEPGDFTTTVATLAPFGVGRDVMLTSVGWYQPWADAAGVDHGIQQSVINYQPAVSGQPLGLVIAPPLHIRIDGTEMPIAPTGSASIASATPTISWDAPTHGTAGFYRVDILAQRTFTHTTGATDRNRIVATFFTLEAALSVPAGVLEAGADYSARVTANVGGWEDTRLGQPAGSDASLAFSASGVFHH